METNEVRAAHRKKLPIFERMKRQTPCWTSKTNVECGLNVSLELILSFMGANCLNLCFGIHIFKSKNQSKCVNKNLNPLLVLQFL